MYILYPFISINVCIYIYYIYIYVYYIYIYVYIIYIYMYIYIIYIYVYTVTTFKPFGGRARPRGSGGSYLMFK